MIRRAHRAPGPLDERLTRGRQLVAFPVVTILVLALLAACSTTSSAPTNVTIYPNLVQARDEGFHKLAGHPPFTVNFGATLEGGSGTLSYAWDQDGDGETDSEAINPKPFTYVEPGEYTATVSVSNEMGRRVRDEQRIVVIGEPEWPEWRFGVAEHLNRGHGLYASNVEVETAAQLISEAGIEAVRLDLTWAAVQPDSRDKYEWKDYDYLVGLSQRYGLDLLPVIAYSAEWASTAQEATDFHDWSMAPPSPTEYAWFAYKAVDRYKSNVPAWEVWNEPNTSIFWQPGPDPAQYAELLRHAYLAIKFADPKAVVVLGGLANDESANMPQYVWYPPEEFLQAVYDQGAGPYFDAVGRHPYTHPSLGTGYLVSQLGQLRDVMVANGDGDKPIWLTEYGLSAVPADGVTDEIQGAWLTQSFDALWPVDYVPVVVWYNFREKGTDPNDREQNYGLIGNDWTIKPAYEAYKSYIANSS